MATSHVVPDVVVSADEQMDDFGRTLAERTIELSSAQAEAVNNEVDSGRHDSYSDALEYVIERGLAEIRRQRESAAKAEAARKAAKGKTMFNAMLKLDPGIATDAKRLSHLLKECGLQD